METLIQNLPQFPSTKAFGSLSWHDDDQDTVAEGNRCETGGGGFGNEKDVAERKSRAYAN